MNTKEPEFQDEVKHKITDMTGVVIAKYPMPNMNIPGHPQKWLFDVRGANNVIYYSTPADNWEVVLEREKRE